MKCTQFESHVCDYLDDQLDPQVRYEMDQHRVECSACVEALEEAEFSLALLRETEQVEPPAELIGDIIHETIGVGTGRLAPAGGGESLPAWLQPFVQPFFQPRFVMGMAMTAMSFSVATFYGDRAIEAYRDNGTAAPAAIQSLVEPVENFWERTVAVFDSAAEFYELQSGASKETEEEAQ